MLCSCILMRKYLEIIPLRHGPGRPRRFVQLRKDQFICHSLKFYLFYYESTLKSILFGAHSICAACWPGGRRPCVRADTTGWASWVRPRKFIKVRHNSRIKGSGVGTAFHPCCTLTWPQRRLVTVEEPGPESEWSGGQC
jgi:hypothetical protein